MGTDAATTTKPNVSKKSFGSSYPFDVSIQNQFEGKDDSTIYIVDKVDPLKDSQQLVISITKKDLNNYTLIGLEGTPAHDNYHFAIAFRPGTVRNNISDPICVNSSPKAVQVNEGDETDEQVQAAKEAIKAKSNFSTLLYNALTEAAPGNPVTVHGPVIRPEDQAEVWYCSFQDNIPNFTALAFKVKGVSAELGEGSRSTQVEFLFNNLQLVHDLKGKDQTENIGSFSRMVHVNIISHQGSSYVPMYFGVLGKNTLLNQLDYPNTLDIFFETIGRVPIQFGPHTEIDFYFPYVENADTEKSKMFFGSNNDVMTADGYSLISDSDQNFDRSYRDEANEIKVVRAKFHKTSNKKFLKQFSYAFHFKNIKISGDDGMVMLGVSIRNVPGYWDTDFQIPIIKETSQFKDGALRLGTNKLDISGAVAIGDTLSDKEQAPVTNPSAILELNSTTQGFLMPRMTKEERIAIKEPADGLMVFEIGNGYNGYGHGLFFFNNGSWLSMQGPIIGEKLWGGIVFSLDTNSRIGIMAQEKDVDTVKMTYANAFKKMKINSPPDDGLDIWRVPTKDELSLLYEQSEIIGNFNKSRDNYRDEGYPHQGFYYWSSDENGWERKVIDFLNGIESNQSREVSCLLRAVRSFKY